VLALMLTSAFAVPRVHAQLAAARPHGWSFTYTAGVTTAGPAQPGADLALDVVVWRGMARITARSGAMRGMTGEGGMILLRAADSVMSIVNPSRRDELRVTMAEFGGMMGGMGGAALPLEVTDVSASVRVRGVGQPLAGFMTRTVEVDNRYTLTILAPGGRRSVRMTERQVVDVSRDVERLDPGFRAFANEFIRGLGLPAEARRKLRQAERGMPAGFPVRSATDATTVSGADTVRTQRTAAISALRREAVDTMTFVVPAGFRVTEMSRLLQQRRQP